MTIRVINGHEIEANIVPSAGVGVFGFKPLSDLALYIAFIEKKQTYIVLSPSELAHEPAKMDVLFTLGDEHRAELLRLSIHAMRDQLDQYQPEDYQPVLAPLLSEDESYKLEMGCRLLKVDFKRHFDVIVAGLLSALDHGFDRFYEEYLNALRQFCPIEAEDFSSDVDKTDFLENAVQPYIMQNEGFSASTTLLNAYWVNPLINALWLGQLRHSAKWALGLRRNVPETLLYLSSSAMPLVGEDLESRYTISSPLIDPEIGERLVWFDASRFSHAGLSPRAVEFVLQQHDQALLIDVVKLLVAKYTESPQIQESCKFDEPRRYAGLTDELSERYGITSNNITRQKVKAACHFLDALRWGPSFEKHVKFFSFETGLKDHDELTVSYMKGFTKPLQDAERIVPMIKHPKGSTRSRASYNRQGLSLASWLVENSQIYLSHDGAGVPLDESAINRFMAQVGYSRKRSLDSVLKSFEDYGAIEINNGLIKLGEKNRAEERLILEGAHRSRQGRIGGRKSAEKKRRKFKP